MECFCFGLSFILRGELYKADDLRITLQASNPDNPRIDVIVATEDSEFSEQELRLPMHSNLTNLLLHRLKLLRYIFRRSYRFWFNIPQCNITKTREWNRNQALLYFWHRPFFGLNIGYSNSTKFKAGKFNLDF